MTTLVVDTMVTGVVRKLMAERDEARNEVERLRVLTRDGRRCDACIESVDSVRERDELRDELADANVVIARLELMRDKLLCDRVGLQLEAERLRSAMRLAYTALDDAPELTLQSIQLLFSEGNHAQLCELNDAADSAHIILGDALDECQDDAEARKCWETNER